MAAPMEVDSDVVDKNDPTCTFKEAPQHHGSSDARSIIEKAKLCQKDDPYAAKSLLLMAKTLYPTEFCVQFEAYIVEKSGQSTIESSQSLIQLFSRFKEEERLREELFLMSSSLQNEANTEQKFYRELFEKMPESHQKNILLFCCEESKDKHEKCKIQLLLMKRFPAFIREYGLSLIDSLLELDKVSGGRLPRNKFRQLLVTEVLPIILESDDFEFNSKQLSKWLYMSIEFYISVAIQPKLKATSSDILKSPNSGKTADGTMSETGEGPNGDEHSEIISDITNPWERLHTLFVTIAQRSGWNLDYIPPVSMGYADSFTSLSSFLQSSQPDDIGSLKSVFYSATMLFFRSMYTYFNLINPGVFGANQTSSGVSPPYNFLLEDLESKKRTRKHKHKKKKIEGGKEIVVDGDSVDDPNYQTAAILIGEGVGLNSDVIKAFTTAVNCWQLINSRDTFKKDFAWLLHRWRGSQWPWIRLFQIDLHIYRGEHSQALQMIQEAKTKFDERAEDQTKIRVQLSLQQASCHFSCGQYLPAAEAVLSILPAFEALGSPSCSTKNATDKSLNPAKHSRLLHVMPCKVDNLLPYCIQLIYMTFKKRVFPFADASDTALGHMITLMQYDWPKEETTFAEILKRVTKAGSFSYPVFFSYIIALDFLEEFAYLVTPDAGGIKLDLFPPCITIQRQQRTITRGVTRGGKEDFRVNIEKQVLRCEENKSQLIYKFLISEKDSLLMCLSAHNGQG